MFDQDEDVLDDEVDFDDVEEEEGEKEGEQPSENAESISNIGNNYEVDRLVNEREQLLKERELLLKERDEAYKIAEESRYSSIKNAIDTFKNEYERIADDTVRIQKQIERARIDGDIDTLDKLNDQLLEKVKLGKQIEQEINNATYQLNQRQPIKREETFKEEVKQEVESDEKKYARKWLENNKWYNDPKYAEKRKAADAAFKKAIADKYSTSTQEFWDYITEQSNKVENKNNERRTPPAVPNTSSNARGGNMSNKRKADRDILEQTNRIMEMRGVTAPEGDPEYKRIKQAVYKSVERQFNEARNKKSSGVF